MPKYFLAFWQQNLELTNKRICKRNSGDWKSTSLNCISENLDSELYWLKEGIPLTEKKGEYTIFQSNNRNSTLNLSGKSMSGAKYTCVEQNHKGEKRQLTYSGTEIDSAIT